MSTVEERVTKLVFDVSQFGPKIQAVLNQLAQLKESLKLDGAQKGLQNVNDAAGKFSMTGMKDQVSGVMGQFSALQVAAITALSNIVNKAVDAGQRIIKSLTLDPIMGGFREYETQLNAVQTILANTGLKGAEGLAKVSAKLDELNHYSDQTIYNFTEMAKNIGTFTAAGVDLDKSTAAIKGIANLAAISGSNSVQASTAMYQLSQALSAGKVSLEDWNSVVNAGMGGKIFRDSLIETAKVHGVNVDAIIKKQGSFRNSIQEGWITTDVLAETLAKFTGDLSAEQLKSLGYTKDQIAGIMEMGKTATDAATKVKTMTQLLDTLREAATSGWAKTWQIIFGDFDEARGMFTEVSNYLGGIINNFSDARNELLKGWKELGGRDALIDGIAAAFEALLSVLKPIGQAFREMFPAATAQDLYNLTVGFRDFMERLKIGEETANNLRRTFAGFFAIIGIGYDILSAAVKVIANLIGKFAGGSGGILKFTGNIGDFLVALRQALQEGRAFEKIFGAIGKVIEAVGKAIGFVASLFARMFRHLDLAPAEEMLGRFTRAAKPAVSLGELLSAVYQRVANFMKNAAEGAYNAFVKLVAWIQKVVKGFQDLIGAGGEGVSGGFLKGVNTAALITFLTLLYNFFSNFKPAEFLEALVDSFEALTGALRGMQHALNAAALLGIALAIGILAISMDKLSKIDQAGLIRASAAIAVLVSELAGAFVLFDKIGGTLGAAKLIVMSAGLIGLGTALLILVPAVEKLSKISWDGLAKGLTGVLVLMGALVAGAKFLPTDVVGIIATSVALVILTIAVRNLVNAVEDLAKLKWEELAKGLVGVATLLGSLALFTKFATVSKGGIASGAGLILIATALKILASAVGGFVKYNWEQLARGLAGVAGGLTAIGLALAFLPPTTIFSATGILIVASSLGLIANAVAKMSKMSWAEIGRGLTVMAGALVAIALAIGFLPPTSLLSAVGVLIVAASLGMIYEALNKMSGMSWEEIGKSLTVLAGSLFIIAAALLFMQTAVPGAFAVLIVAASFRILLPVLEALGAMSWESIAKGLAALAGVFLVIGLAAVFLGPMVGIIAGLAGSIALLGIAVFAAGVGVLAFATGLGILAVVGAGATAAIVGIVAGLVGLIPLVMEQIGLGLIAFAKIIGVSGKAITEAMTTLLTSLLDSIIKVTPKIVETLIVLLDAMLALFVDYTPKLVDAGGKIIIAFLDGMAKHTPKASDKAADLIVAFLDGIGRNLGRIIQSGIDLIIKFINGMADGIRNNSTRMGEAGMNLATALIEGVIRGIGAGLGRAVAAAANLAKDMFNAAKNALGIKSPSKKFAWLMEMSVAGIEAGEKKYGFRAADAAAAVGEGMVDSMAKTLNGLSKVLGSDLIDFDPTITPVLDLSNVKKTAGELISLLDVPTLDISTSYKKAQAAGSSYEASRKDDGAEDPTGSTGDTYNYTQYNTSPKALSKEEIYRQTKNLISTKKGASSAQ